MRRPRRRTRRHPKPSWIPLAAENRGPKVISQKSYHTNKRLKLLAQRKLVN
jgi:hypothetical protein